MNKPKLNYKPGNKDNCYTPSYALAPIKPYIPAESIIWECACGSMHMAYELGKQWRVFATDKDSLDFLSDPPAIHADLIVTNPPFSLKYRFLARCYEIGKPFALLMPVDTLGAQAAQRLFDKHGVQVILMDKRIDYIMPNKGLNGAGAQFSSAWFTSGLGLPAQLNYASIADEKAAFKRSIVGNVFHA